MGIVYQAGVVRLKCLNGMVSYEEEQREWGGRIGSLEMTDDFGWGHRIDRSFLCHILVWHGS
jgi:hypothetical protein